MFRHPNAYLTSFVVNGPIILAPHFSPAKRVTFLTSPLQLNVSIDHTTVPTRRIPTLCESPQPVVPIDRISAALLRGLRFCTGAPRTPSPEFLRSATATGNWWVFDHLERWCSTKRHLHHGQQLYPSRDVVTGIFVRGAQVGFPNFPVGSAAQRRWPRELAILQLCLGAEFNAPGFRRSHASGRPGTAIYFSRLVKLQAAAVPNRYGGSKCRRERLAPHCRL